MLNFSNYKEQQQQGQHNKKKNS